MGPNIKRLMTIAALLFLLIPNGAYAHIGATGIVKERMDAMSEMGANMGVIADMIKGKRAFDPIVARYSALVLHDHAIKSAGQYPGTQDSKHGKHSQALPAIWTERNLFNKLMRDLAVKTMELAQIAELNDPSRLRAQFGKVAKTCSACHEKFRKPKQ